MPIELDGLKVFRAIVDCPAQFPIAVKELNKLAHSLLAKQVKAIKANSELTSLTEMVGGEAMALVVEGFSDRDITTLLRRVDPHNTGAGNTSAGERRGLIVSLGEKRVEPVAAPPPPTRRSRSKSGVAAAGVEKSGEVAPAAPAKKRTMRSSSMGAVREKKG